MIHLIFTTSAGRYVKNDRGESSGDIDVSMIHRIVSG